MHEVKAALQASNWDIDAALEALQRQGLTAASKKVGHCTSHFLTWPADAHPVQASRTAAEGLVAVASSEDAAAIVEVNCETDFVARNPKFQVRDGHPSVVIQWPPLTRLTPPRTWLGASRTPPSTWHRSRVPGTEGGALTDPCQSSLLTHTSTKQGGHPHSGGGAQGTPTDTESACVRVRVRFG